MRTVHTGHLLGREGVGPDMPHASRTGLQIPRGDSEGGVLGETATRNASCKGQVPRQDSAT